jgi:hypothetical protein
MVVIYALRDYGLNCFSFDYLLWRVLMNGRVCEKSDGNDKLPAILITPTLGGAIYIVI